MIPRVGPAFIKTETFSQVSAAVEDSKTPVLVLGMAGLGKTTMLAGIADEWVKSGRKCVFLSLDPFERGDDFFLLLRRMLAETLDLPHTEDGDVIRGSSRAALRATIDLIDSAGSDLLLVFDGLDVMADQTPVIQLLDQIGRSVRVRVIASSRDQFGFPPRLFRSIFEILPFTEAQVVQFVRRLGPSTLSDPEVEAIAKASEGLPLATSILLEMVRKEGILPDLRPNASGGTLMATLVRRILERISREHPSKTINALVNLAIIKRPIRPSEHQARLLENLSADGLVRFDTESGFVFSHPLIAEAVLSIVDLTGDSADHLLAKLEFGAEEAERDGLLSGGFITLPEFNDVIGGRKNIVVGDRGTGKSAMFAHLSLPTCGNSLAKNPLVKPLTHPADMLRRLEAGGSQLSTADQFRAGWLTLVAYSVSDQVKAFSSAEHVRAALYLKEMLGDETKTGWMLFKSLKSIVDRVLGSSVKIKLGPVEIQPAGQPGLRGASAIELRSFIKDAAESISGTGQIALVPLDRIDEIHKYDRDLQQKAVQGLFLAEGDLAQLRGIRLVIFLRSDLFKIYDIQEKNKLISRSMSISWTKLQLLQFLISRVLSNTCLHRMREYLGSPLEGDPEVALAAIFPAEIEGMAITEWLWEWMENGNGEVTPRQIILLLILAAQSPVAQTTNMNKLPIFPSSALQWGMDQLSELSFKELVDDFRVAPTFLANCRSGRVTSFELSAVESLFSKDEGPLSVQVERLERLGFLERIVLQNQDGTRASKFEVPKLFTRGWGIA